MVSGGRGCQGFEGGCRGFDGVEGARWADGAMVAEGADKMDVAAIYIYC